MSPTGAPYTGHPRSLVVYLSLTTVGSAAVVGVAWVLWPVTLTTTGLLLMLALGIVEVHPLRVRHSSRSVLVDANELVLALSALTLPVAEVVWVAIGGALLGTITVRLIAARETFNRTSLPRNILNTSKNILGAVPLIALMAWTGPTEAPALVAVTIAGTIAYGLLTYVFVAAAVQLASGGSVRMSLDDIWQSLPVALVLTAVALPFGLVMRGHDPDWPIILTITVAIVMVSRARMDQDHAAHQLTSLITVSHRLASAQNVGELDELLTQVLADILQCRTVEIRSAEPLAPTSDSLSSRLGDGGRWVVVRHRLLGARWTRLHQDLLDAVCALAAPERRRLELLEQVQEAERFTSLVLTTAGHDITNHLHAATMAAGTVSAWEDRLSRDERHALIERADRAVQQAANVLRDLVAVGSRGLTSSTSAADTALFARGLSPNIHVSADNVGIAAPAPIVERALENLVRNAQRHHDEDEPVEVTIAPAPDDVVRVEVRDRGPGLEPGHVDTLFKPFTQLADDRRQRGSLGLGLFIARGLAESVGGSLEYHDREGGGSVFALTLPSADEDPLQRRKERVVLGPRPDRDAKAAGETGLGGEVADQHSLSE